MKSYEYVSVMCFGILVFILGNILTVSQPEPRVVSIVFGNTIILVAILLELQALLQASLFPKKFRIQTL